MKTSVNQGKIIKILFVCHGNICRSPMAEFVMKDYVDKAGLATRIYVASAATSGEEIGSPVHRGTAKILAAHGISVAGKTAVRITRADYDYYDYIIGMDSYNMRNMLRLFGEDTEHKLSLLLDYTGEYRDVADPWYTGDFEKTYEDVTNGCRALLMSLQNSEGKS